MAVSKVKILEHDADASIFCNMTERGSANTKLVKVSWFKDGVVNRTVLITGQPKSNNPLEPLFLKDVGVKDGGEYTCLLEVRLRDQRPYNVTDSTVISSKCATYISVFFLPRTRIHHTDTRKLID